MQWKSVSKMSMVAIPVMIVCGLLVAPSSRRVAASSPKADDEDTKVCTNHTLHGDYGSQIEGTILGPNLPFRGLAMGHFDGNGNITQVDHIVFNGIPPLIEWTAGTGTYSVNPDCTGSGVINSPSSQGPVNLHFVVVNHGKQINQVVDANAATAVAYRVD
jgi:hypothetical protein